MALYQLSNDANIVQRTSDGVWIPNDSGNSDWRAYQGWLKAGNVAHPAPVAQVPVEALTADQLATILIAKAGSPLTVQDVTAAKSAAAAIPGPIAAQQEMAP